MISTVVLIWICTYGFFLTSLAFMASLLFEASGVVQTALTSPSPPRSILFCPSTDYRALSKWKWKKPKPTNQNEPTNNNKTNQPNPKTNIKLNKKTHKLQDNPQTPKQSTPCLNKMYDLASPSLPLAHLLLFGVFHWTLMFKLKENAKDVHDMCA